MGLRRAALRLALVGLAGTGACRRTATSPQPGPPEELARGDRCVAIDAVASERLRFDARRVCNAAEYDEPGDGDDGPRQAFECLVERGATARLFEALARSELPAARVYGREGLERTGGWTPELLRAAVLDRAPVHYEGEDVSAAIFGVAAVLQSDRALAAELLPEVLRTSTDSNLVIEVLGRGGHEPWLDDRLLERIAEDERLHQDARELAREVLHERGTGTFPPVPGPWGRSGSRCIMELEREWLERDRREKDRLRALERQWREGEGSDVPIES